jgi:quinol monooxygenase YgiN
VNDQVAWHVELAISPGGVAALKRLTAEMIAASRADPGTLSYQRFISDNESVLHVYERYADSDAAVAHLEMFAHHFGARYSQLVERRRFSVFGTVNDALRRTLDGYGDLPYW